MILSTQPAVSRNHSVYFCEQIMHFCSIKRYTRIQSAIFKGEQLSNRRDIRAAINNSRSTRIITTYFLDFSPEIAIRIINKSVSNFIPDNRIFISIT